MIRLHPHLDERGGLVKVFQASALGDIGFAVAECLVSWSHRGVVRGLHLQRPPEAHAKLVLCLSGAVFDVALDLRAGSPTFGQHHATELRADRHDAVLVPAGCAHGWQALTEPAVVLYLISSERCPDAEDGVRWDSAGIAWPLPVHGLSARDAGLLALSEFQPVAGMHHGGDVSPAAPRAGGAQP